MWGGASPPASASTDWPAYLGGPQHSSRSLATAFSVASSSSAVQAWHWSPPAVSGRPTPKLDASPIVSAGTVYIGSNTGVFYALSETTGAVVWSAQLDTVGAKTCGAKGISSTATVATDPASGTRVVNVAGARSLYALNASTGGGVGSRPIGPAGSTTANDYYNWSSPTVVAGHVYMGIASQCDRPLVRGGVIELDQHTGAVLHTWYAVPSGSIGGTIWSSVAATKTGANLWVATGNECDPIVDSCPQGNKIGDSLSIVHLSGSLTRLEAWQVPGAAGSGHDWDFGSSPTLFGTSPAAPLSTVGACNKNGEYYALSA